MNLTNWKTTLTALIIVIVAVIKIVDPVIVTDSTFTAVISVLSALGLYAAKDKDVTGGTVLNASNDPSVVKQSAQVVKS